VRNCSADAITRATGPTRGAGLATPRQEVLRHRKSDRGQTPRRSRCLAGRGIWAWTMAGATAFNLANGHTGERRDPVIQTKPSRPPRPTLGWDPHPPLQVHLVQAEQVSFATGRA